jgi:hypothetical protein
VIRCVSVLAIVAGCGSSQHVEPPVVKQPAAARLPDGPPLITPGEHMQYKLALQGVELAVYDFGIGETTQVEGKQAVLVQSHAKTVGIGALIKVDDYFSSYVDVATGRPLRWVADEYTSDGSHKEKTDADLGARSGTSVPVMFHLDEEPPQPEPQKVTQPDVWDFNSFMVALRGWEGAPGTAAVAEVFRSRFMWHVDIKIHGKEKVTTELGELPALRIDARLYKLERDGSRAPGNEERQFSVWVSDDDGRVPLQINARTDYGDMKMTLLDYQPGNGQRLRK